MEDKIDIKRQFQDKGTPMSIRGFDKIRWNQTKLDRYGLKSKSYKGRTIVFQNDVITTLQKEYDDVLAPNIGAKTFFDMLKKKYIGISRDNVISFLKLQPKYQEGQQRVKQPMAKSIISTRPFLRIQIDTIDTSRFSQTYPHTLTCIDTFSKFLFVRPVKNNRSATIDTAMKDILKEMPKQPTIIQSDNGTEFATMLKGGDLYDSFYDDYKIVRSSPYNPASNGMIERIHRFLKKYVEFAQEKRKINFKTQVQNVANLYNERPHSITRKRPSELQKPDLDDELRKDVVEKIKKASQKVNPAPGFFPPLKKGDYVRLAILKKSPLEKLYHNWTKEIFIITQARKNDTYKIARPNLKGETLTSFTRLYQRDYLYKIPLESAEKILRDEKERNEEAEKVRFEAQERLRAREAEKRQKKSQKKSPDTPKYKYKRNDNLLFKKKFFIEYDPTIPLDDGFSDLKGTVTQTRNDNYYIKFYSGEYEGYEGQQKNYYPVEVVESDYVSLIV